MVDLERLTSQRKKQMEERRRMQGGYAQPLIYDVAAWLRRPKTRGQAIVVSAFGSLLRRGAAMRERTHPFRLVS